MEKPHFGLLALAVLCTSCVTIPRASDLDTRVDADATRPDVGPANDATDDAATDDAATDDAGPIDAATDDAGPIDLCGNGRIDQNEECDGSNLNGMACQDLRVGLTSFVGGSLQCERCRFDTVGCGVSGSRCNDGIFDSNSSTCDLLAVQDFGFGCQDSRIPVCSDLCEEICADEIFGCVFGESMESFAEGEVFHRVIAAGTTTQAWRIKRRTLGGYLIQSREAHRTDWIDEQSAPTPNEACAAISATRMR